jgi:hypothetical protein
MSADVREDEEVLDELDFDLACQARMVTYANWSGVRVMVDVSDPCPEQAVALLRCRGCGEGFYVCLTHLRVAQGMTHLFCRVCDREGSPGVVFEVVPLPVPFGGAR